MSYSLSHNPVKSLVKEISLEKNHRMQFTITVDRDEDGVRITEDPWIPGCVSHGETQEQAEAREPSPVPGVLGQ